MMSQRMINKNIATITLKIKIKIFVTSNINSWNNSEISHLYITVISAPVKHTNTINHTNQYTFGSIGRATKATQAKRFKKHKIRVAKKY